MNIQIFCTHSCSHRPNLERELQDIGVDYQVVFVEDEPELATQFCIRHSPSLVVNNQLVCTGQPDEAELRRILVLTDVTP